MRPAILLLCAACGLLACSCLPILDSITRSPESWPPSETFYTSIGGSDYRRMALIEPYYALSIDKTSWSIELLTDSIRYQPSVNDIRSLAVMDRRYIVTYSTDTLYAGSRVSELWFVIAPEKRIERGFISQADLLAWLEAEAGIRFIWLSDANALYTTLIEQGSLPWFPEAEQGK
jgi:hypothetical protein